jgi:hypothetical protein
MYHTKHIGFVAAFLICLSSTAWATFNYEYGPDEYVTISNGISPDGKLAITAHGEGEMGYDNFHLYLFKAETGKKIGPLEEIIAELDTGAGAYGAKWSKDSSEVTIVYRVDRHAPLKSMTYRLEKGRAIPTTKAPTDITNEDLIKLWGALCSNSNPPVKTFGSALNKK